MTPFLDLPPPLFENGPFLFPIDLLLSSSAFIPRGTSNTTNKTQICLRHCCQVQDHKIEKIGEEKRKKEKRWKGIRIEAFQMVVRSIPGES